MSSRTTKHTAEATQAAPEADILVTAEAARYLGLSAHTLHKWRILGTGPRFFKLGRAVRYRRADLDTYLAAGARRGQARS